MSRTANAENRGAPKAQLNGALDACFGPGYDFGNNRDPGPVGPAKSRCRKMVEGSGQDTGSGDGRVVMFTTCDVFNFLTMAISNGGLSERGFSCCAHGTDEMDAASTFGTHLQKVDEMVFPLCAI